MLALIAALTSACLGTETGNPTRSACPCAAGHDSDNVPCPAPIVLHVSDAERLLPVRNLTANGKPCVETTLQDTRCELVGAPYDTPGVHTIELSAPGFATTRVEVPVKEDAASACCACRYLPSEANVVLAHAE